MRPIVYVLSFLGLIGLGAWAYRENYATQASLREVVALQDEIAALRENLTVQRAEWAYLNRPERLRALATLNFDRLGLLPMEPTQFGATSSVAYPPVEGTQTATTDVSSFDVDPAALEAAVLAANTP
jgi:hypothetical protein